MTSVHKRYPKLRRSNRDRQALYKSLDENVMGIQKGTAIFQHILKEANNPIRHGLYSPVDGDGDNNVRRSSRYRDSYPPIQIHQLRNRHFLAKTDSEDLDDEDENLHSQRGRSTRTVGRPSGRHHYKEKVLSRESLNGMRNRLRNHRFEVVSTATSSKIPDYKALNADDGEYGSSMYERVKSRRQNGSFSNDNCVRFASEFDDDLDSLPKRRRRGMTRKLLCEVNPLVDVDDVDNEIREENKKHNDDEEERNGDEDKDDANEEEEVEENVPKQYYLRQKRAQVERFGYTRDIPIRSCRASSVYTNGITAADRLTRYSAGRGNRKLKKFRKSRQRGRYNNRFSSGSSSSSTSSSSDNKGIRTAQNDMKEEARFERRKIRSLQKRRHSVMPTNMSSKDFDSTTMSVRQKLRAVGNSCADIDPMQIDNDVGFGDIGGLTQHIQSLKEVVVFPLLYPELFQRFDVTPPKGVLFYGPPGTGKTLVARALSNECSYGDQKVAFFMRKGADCLSKWVGESERQLRLLFDQAYTMRPSIIFFDEIDGLAPVRSSRQDQIHSSIVSTLLALMDGLDKRGEIIVIGSTNRLDSIDPALRRPGRFDREMRFDLPDKTARESILQIHTKSWTECKPSDKLLKWLAEKTSGYCGADLKALCSDSVLIALREKFPHIYLSSEKLLIDPTSVQVDKRHFEDSMRLIVPAARRDFSVISHQLNPRLSCFIQPIIDTIMTEKIPSGYIQRKTVDNLWPTDLERVMMALKVPPSVPAARLLLHGSGFLGQTTHFLPVLINQLDHLPVFSMSCEQMFASGHVEENVSQTIRSALRATNQGTPVVLLIPDIDVLEFALPTTAWKMLISSLNSFVGFTSAFVLASIQQNYNECSDDIKRVFRHQNIFELFPPTESMRLQYFQNIFANCSDPPVIFDVSLFPKPPKAAQNSTIRNFSSEELKEFKVINDQMFRQFRIALRDLLGRLVRDRRFNVFNLPVDKEDAEDYYDIIKNPMCLSQIMSKIDQQCYTNKQTFLDDIRLIMNNALEYNPNRNMEDKTIRHSAFALIDMAEALFETDIDDELLKKLEQVTILSQKSRTQNSSADNCSAVFSKVIPKQTNNVDKGFTKNAIKCARKRRHSRGAYSFKRKRQINNAKHRQTLSIVKKYKSMRSTQSNDDDEGGDSAKEVIPLPEEEAIYDGSNLLTLSRDKSAHNGVYRNTRWSKEPVKEVLTSFPPAKSTRTSKDNDDKIHQSETQNSVVNKAVIINKIELEKIIIAAVNKTNGWSVPDIECLGAEIVQCVENFSQKWDRSNLPLSLDNIVCAFCI